MKLKLNITLNTVTFALQAISVSIASQLALVAGGANYTEACIIASGGATLAALVPSLRTRFLNAFFTRA